MFISVKAPHHVISIKPRVAFTVLHQVKYLHIIVNTRVTNKYSLVQLDRRVVRSEPYVLLDFI